MYLNFARQHEVNKGRSLVFYYTTYYHTTMRFNSSRVLALSVLCGVESFAPAHQRQRIATYVRCSNDVEQPAQIDGAAGMETSAAGDANTLSSTKVEGTIEPDDSEGTIFASERSISPETIHFNNKLVTQSQNFDNKSAATVEERLWKAVDNALAGEDAEDTGIRPNVVSFTAAVNAWARSTQPHAAQQAEKILKRAIELWRSGYIDARPNSYTFNACITAWSRSREKNAADNCVRLLEEMNQFYDEAGRPDDLQPDSRCYNLAINAVARSRVPGCADKARGLLNQMETLHDEGPFPDLVPDSLTFGAIINSYANDRSDQKASQHAAALMQQMESMHQYGITSCKPTTFVYNSCLNAFAKAGGSANAEKAELFLEVMENLSNSVAEDDAIRPDSISYSTVINAYANSNWIDAGEKADVLISKMKTLDALGEDNVSCNAISYTAAIKAHVNSMKAMLKEQDRAEDGTDNAQVLLQSRDRAWDLLVECALLRIAGDRQCQPSNATYSLVREAFQLTGDKQEGIQKADAVRQRIENNQGNKKYNKRGVRRFRAK